MSKKFKIGSTVIVSLSMIIYFLLIYIFSINVELNDVKTISIVGILVIVGINNIFIKKEKKIDYKKIIISIMIIGIILRTAYILYTPISQRQHDLDEAGHLEYIEIIYETGKFPTTNTWQFYHQPLHHIIATAWLKVNTMFGVDLNVAEEGIQILTAIYSSLIMVITYCILKEMKIKDIYKVIVMAIIAVHPTFIILAGSINNDILVTMFTFWVLLYLIKWYKKPNIKNTILLALLTACTALTKISGTIVAVPIMYIFIRRVYKDCIAERQYLKTIKKYLIKFIIFGIISLGLGLSYSIRNIILFDQSIFYVPEPGPALYCGDETLFDRFYLFSQEWKNIYCNPYTDCNMISYLIKCSMFGEYRLTQGSMLLSMMLLAINVIIILISIISLVKVIINKIRKRNDKELADILNIFIIFYIVQMILYIYANISKPFGCTMDFRYVVPTILTGSIFIVESLKDISNKWYKSVLILVIIFAILSIIFELTQMNLLRI